MKRDPVGTLYLVFATCVAAFAILISILAVTTCHEPQRFCHSVTEDGPITGCDYHGDTNTWEPR